MIDPALRAALMTALSPDDCEVLDHPWTQTTVDDYPAPFLPTARIVRLTAINPGVRSQALDYYLGLAPDRPAVRLTGNAAAFVRMAQAEGLVLDTPAAAAAYVIAYLDVTPAPGQGYYLI